MSSPVKRAPVFRGRSKQSLRAWVRAPQFSQAPLRYLVATLLVTPRWYQSEMVESWADLRRSGWGRWCLRVAPAAPKYQGAEVMNSGMWGLMSRPSSSCTAGAVPAFRISSSSFICRYSSRVFFGAVDGPGPAPDVPFDFSTADGGTVLPPSGIVLSFFLLPCSLSGVQGLYGCKKSAPVRFPSIGRLEDLKKAQGNFLPSSSDQQQMNRIQQMNRADVF